MKSRWPPGHSIFADPAGVVPTGAKALTGLKRVPRLLGTPSADLFGFKSFRAGKATEMAATGFGLAEILQAGEWRSSAYLRYLDESIADEGEMLRQAVDGSDSGEEA